jgi:competence protein ComEA
LDKEPGTGNPFSHVASYSRGEKIGIAALLLLIALISIFSRYISDWFRPGPVAFPPLPALLAESNIDSVGEEHISSVSSILSPFNPNEMDYQGFVAMGFNKRVASNVVKYREKGGVFHKPEDLLRIWGMDTGFFLRIKPFLRFDRKGETAPSPNAAVPEGRAAGEVYGPVDINQADTVALRRIKGVGVVLARRIVSYREKLGGFARLEQLKEVYGIDTLLIIQAIAKGEVNLGNGVYRKLPVNQTHDYKLLQHPYVRTNQAKALLAYIQQHGPLRSESDFRKVLVFTETERWRILPYLDFN